MKLYSWNVRGLRSPRTFRALKNLLLEKSPDVVFLMETRMSENQIATVVRQLG